MKYIICSTVLALSIFVVATLSAGWEGQYCDVSINHHNESGIIIGSEEYDNSLIISYHDEIEVGRGYIHYKYKGKDYYFKDSKYLSFYVTCH